MVPVQPSEGIFQREIRPNDYTPAAPIKPALVEIYRLLKGDLAESYADHDMQVASKLVDQNIDENMAAALVFMSGNKKTFN